MRLATPLFLVLGGCGPDTTPRWSDQLVPAGPCWEVNLGDGVDAADNTELHTLFDCLNRTGDFDPLSSLDVALDAPTRGGQTVGGELVGLAAEAGDGEVDLAGLFEGLMALYEENVDRVPLVAEMFVELVYARPYEQVEALDPWGQAEGSAVAGGLIAPAVPLLSLSSAVLLDEGDDILAFVADLPASPHLDDAACTYQGLMRSEATADTRAALAEHLGPAMVLAAPALRDLTGILVASPAGGTFFAAASDDLRIILSDQAVIDDLTERMIERDAAGDMLPILSGVTHLATVDVDGGALGVGEVSALSRFIRLLASANGPVDCGLVSTDNLAVLVLDLLALIPADTVEAGIPILAGLLDNALLDFLLRTGADLGVCDGLSSDMVEDLAAVDRLSDEPSLPLLRVMLDLLAAVRQDGGDESRIPSVVGVVDLAWDRGMLPPIEALLVAVEGAPGADAAFAGLLHIIIDPSELDTAGCPDGARPMDLPVALAVVEAAIVGEGSAWSTLLPLASPLLQADETWRIVDRLGGLLQGEPPRLAQAPALLSDLLAEHHDLLAGDPFARLRDRGVVDPLLRVVEAPEVGAALLVSERDLPGPLPFATRLVQDGTLDTVLRTVELLVDWLDAPSPSG